jgi:glycosyltransferase A (GT-A) superfamily protein (DUF2064 family)
MWKMKLMGRIEEPERRCTTLLVAWGDDVLARLTQATTTTSFNIQVPLPANFSISTSSTI